MPSPLLLFQSRSRLSELSREETVLEWVLCALLGCEWTVAYSEFTVPLLLITLHDAKIHLDERLSEAQRLRQTGYWSGSSSERL